MKHRNSINTMITNFLNDLSPYSIFSAFSRLFNNIIKRSIKHLVALVGFFVLACILSCFLLSSLAQAEQMKRVEFGSQHSNQKPPLYVQTKSSNTSSSASTSHQRDQSSKLSQKSWKKYQELASGAENEKQKKSQSASKAMHDIKNKNGQKNKKATSGLQKQDTKSNPKPVGFAALLQQYQESKNARKGMRSLEMQ